MVAVKSVIAFCMINLSCGFFLPHEKVDENHQLYYPSPARNYDPFEYSSGYGKVEVDFYGHFRLNSGQKTYLLCYDKRSDPRNDCRPLVNWRHRGPSVNFVPSSSGTWRFQSSEMGRENLLHRSHLETSEEPTQSVVRFI